MAVKDERVLYVFAAITCVQFWKLYLLSRNISTVTWAMKNKPQDYGNIDAREWETLRTASADLDMCDVCTQVVNYVEVSAKLWLDWYPWLWKFIGSVADLEFVPRVIMMMFVETVILEALKDTLLLVWADSLGLSPEAWTLTVWNNLKDAFSRGLGICCMAKLYSVSLEYLKSPFLVDYSSFFEVAALIWLPFKNGRIKMKTKSPARVAEARQHWPVIRATSKNLGFPTSVIRISYQGHVQENDDLTEMMTHLRHALTNKSWFIAGRKDSDDSFHSARSSIDSFHSIQNFQPGRFDVSRILGDLFTEKETKEITYHAFGTQVMTINRAVILALPPPQLNALFVVELAQWKYRHLSIKFFLFILRIGFHMCASSLTYGEGEVFGFNSSETPYMPKLVSDLVMGPVIDQVFDWTVSLFSRYFDLFADQYALSDVPHTELIKALKALAGTSSKYPVFDSAFAAFNLYHPTIPERLRSIKSAAA